MGERDSVVQGTGPGLLASQRGFSPRSDHWTGADTGAPGSHTRPPHPVKDSREVGAERCSVPPRDTRFPVLVLPDGSRLPGASVWLERRYPGWPETDTAFVSGDGTEIPAAEVHVGTAGTEEDTRSSRGQLVLLCHCCAADPHAGLWLRLSLALGPSGAPSPSPCAGAARRRAPRAGRLFRPDPLPGLRNTLRLLIPAEMRCIAWVAGRAGLRETISQLLGTSPGHSIGCCHHHPIGRSVRGTELFTHDRWKASGCRGQTGLRGPLLGKAPCAGALPTPAAPGAALPSLPESGSGVSSSCSHPGAGTCISENQPDWTLQTGATRPENAAEFAPWPSSSSSSSSWAQGCKTLLAP